MFLSLVGSYGLFFDFINVCKIDTKGCSDSFQRFVISVYMVFSE